MDNYYRKLQSLQTPIFYLLVYSFWRKAIRYKFKMLAVCIFHKAKPIAISKLVILQFICYMTTDPV